MAVFGHGARGSPRGRPAPWHAPMRKSGQLAPAATGRGAALVPWLATGRKVQCEADSSCLEPERLGNMHTEFFTNNDSESDQTGIEFGKNSEPPVGVDNV